MTFYLTRHALGMLALAGCAAFATSALADTCTDLTKLTPPNATVTAATMVTGAFESPKDGLGLNTKVAVPFCRVEGIAKSEAASSIGFELWLPAADKWNGRMLASGDLGQSGAPNYPALNDALTRGFAALGDNLGHNSNAFSSDWAIGHPERVKDWGGRGSHFSAVAGKAIAAAYYGKAPSHSYFTGCSHGGGTALAEPQRYPEDYDGIIAGAFGTNWTGVQSAYVYEAQAALNDKASNLSAAKLALVGKAAVAACDAQDGVKDGIIGNPQQCHFDPAVLQCKAGDAADCLTAAQIVAVKKLYAGPHNSAGKVIYAGLEPGSEFMWGFLVAGPETFLGGDFYKDIVYDGKAFDWHKFSLDTDVATAEKKLAADIDNRNGDLSKFAAHGGKVIMYNGWADGLIQPGNAIEYYDSVVKAAGGNADKFSRLYLAPGMGHCSSGPGPNSFGETRYLNAGQPNPPVLDAKHDMISAIVAWVEEGKAPAAIIATKFKDDDAAKGIAMQRPLCPYPAVAKYDGKGDSNAAASFTCAKM
ncbi:MAG TPA: tannase/feruloyl esterase family alpha/beta hydrolase [Stellaceae bacterium]